MVTLDTNPSNPWIQLLAKDRTGITHDPRRVLESKIVIGKL
jgi:hypothetical protein